VPCVFTNALEELLPSSRAPLAACFMMVSCVAKSSILKMKTCSSETSVNVQQTTRRYIPKDITIQDDICLNKISIVGLVVTQVLDSHRAVPTRMQGQRKIDISWLLACMAFSIITPYVVGICP
jgi:hypothetical protein